MIRDLVFRYCNLKVSQRREIARTLGLPERNGRMIPEYQLSKEQLLAARKHNMLEQLSRMVEELETDHNG